MWIKVHYHDEEMIINISNITTIEKAGMLGESDQARIRLLDGNNYLVRESMKQITDMINIIQERGWQWL